MLVRAEAKRRGVVLDYHLISNAGIVTRGLGSRLYCVANETQKYGRLAGERVPGAGRRMGDFTGRDRAHS